MAGAGRVRRSRRLPEGLRLWLEAAGVAPEEWRDWAGLPEVLLVKVAKSLVAQNEAGWAAWLKSDSSLRSGVRYRTEQDIQRHMDNRQRDGNCLFVFAMVCRNWRKAQLKVGARLRSRVCSDVLLPGSVALAKWALKEGCPKNARFWRTKGCMAEAAARHGTARHVELVKWLCTKVIRHGGTVFCTGGGFAPSLDVMYSAAAGGNVELVQWLRGKGCLFEDPDVDDLDELERGAIFFYAARSGNLELVRWLRGEGCEWHRQSIERAAEAGALELVQWMCQEGAAVEGTKTGELDDEVMSSAAMGGNLMLVRWLRVFKGCKWDGAACALAAKHGHLEILQWLRANGCPADADVTEHAVDQGHVEVLRWARENGCQWEVSAHAALRGGGLTGSIAPRAERGGQNARVHGRPRVSPFGRAGRRPRTDQRKATSSTTTVTPSRTPRMRLGRQLS